MTISAASHDFDTVHTGGGILFTFRENAVRTTRSKDNVVRATLRHSILVCSLASIILLGSHVTMIVGASSKDGPMLSLKSVSIQLEETEAKDYYNISDNNSGECLTGGQRELGYLTITKEQEYANGTHAVWATYNMTAYNEDTGKRLQALDCRLTSRCEVISTGELSYARSCAGTSTTSNCVKWTRGNAFKTYLMTGPKGTEIAFTSWCQGVLSPASRILYGELDIGPAYYTGDTYSYRGSAVAYIWRLQIE